MANSNSEIEQARERLRLTARSQFSATSLVQSHPKTSVVAAAIAGFMIAKSSVDTLALAHGITKAYSYLNLLKPASRE